MNIVNVLDQIAARLATISGLRVSAYPPDNVQVPAAIVSWPDRYDFDETYGRGSDRMTIPVVVLVEREPDNVAREQLAVFCHGSGSSSIKQVIESGTYSALDSLRVESVAFGVATYAGTDYTAATFSIDVVGSGA